MIYLFIIILPFWQYNSLLGSAVTVLRFFSGVEGSSHVYGKVSLDGRELPATLRDSSSGIPAKGSSLKIVDIESDGSSVVVE